MLKDYSLSYIFITFTVYVLIKSDCNYIRFNRMKILIYTLLAIAVAIIIFNITLLDFSNLLEGNSLIALIGIVASLCAVCILLIFKMAKSIEEKTR